MLRSKLGWLVLLPALALGYPACVGDVDSEDQEPLVDEESAMVAEDPAMIGTFRSDRYEDGRITLLVLKEDGTYHRSTAQDCAARCTAVSDDGKYLRRFRGDYAIISLKPPRGADADVYQYVFVRDTLALRPLGGRGWMALTKTESKAWCAATEDCALQDLPVGPCATDWYCAANTCRYSCSTLPDE